MWWWPVLNAMAHVTARICCRGSVCLCRTAVCGDSMEFPWVYDSGAYTGSIASVEGLYAESIRATYGMFRLVIRRSALISLIDAQWC